MKRFNQCLTFSILFMFILFSTKVFSQTSILKWPDGKNGCVTLTFDDGSINQFRYAVPLMNERGLHATFFIITGNIPGSKYQPTFIGRPIQKIIDESASIPTNKNNLFERCSALTYLAQANKYPELKDFSDMEAAIGNQFDQKQYKEVYSIIDKAYAVLRKIGHRYNFEKEKNKPENSYHLTWDILKKTHNEGHEIANHTVSHPYMPVLDKANISYEIEKCSRDIEEHLGIKRVLSIECPYGIDDKRVLSYVYPKFPFVRNGLTDSFIKEILRGDPQEPVSKEKEYVQWQRGPVTKTSLDEMKKWIDETVEKNVWLVLVIHGVEGLGWEAIPKERLKKYFDFIISKENRLWIATFQDAYKYIQERMNTKVVTKINSKEITINLSNKLDNKIYNLPLTLKTAIPDSWKDIKITQGQKKLNIETIAEAGKSYVKYNAIPNSANINIKHGH
jgi:peptidoglycan/xylan/chitin deacetylase (PgdA/CDA1 family)